MTLTARRLILSLLLFIGFFCLAIVAYTWFYWFQGDLRISVDEISQSFQWWTIKRSVDDSDLFIVLLSISWMVVFPILSELIFRRRFRRSPSPEIFFVRVFLLTLPLQAVRLGLFFVSSGLFGPLWAEIFTRIALFARFFGLAVLLNTGLFTTDLPFRQSGVVLGTEALAAFALTVLIPVDITQPMGNLLYRVGTWTALGILNVSLSLIAVVSLIGVAFRTENRRYTIIAITFPFLVVGADFLFFGVLPLALAGAVSLSFGAWIVSRQIKEIYQWI